MRRFCWRDDLVHGVRDRDRRLHARLEALLRRRRHRAEQQHREQEHRRDALALAHAAIRVGEARADQRERHAVRLAGEVRGGRREQVIEQAVRPQQVERALAETREEQLLEFVEQARRRNVRRAGPASVANGARADSWIVKPSFASKRTARSIRTGSSR